jgi:hypothetical protein
MAQFAQMPAMTDPAVTWDKRRISGTYIFSLDTPSRSEPSSRIREA